VPVSDRPSEPPDAEPAGAPAARTGTGTSAEAGIEAEIEAEQAALAAAARKRKDEENVRAWGSWRQDRELNRRKVLRSLVGLVVAAVLCGLLAYGCSILRGPQQIRLAPEVSGFVLQPPDPATQELAGRFEAAGAVGPAAGVYRGTDDVTLLAGYGAPLPVQVLDPLLPASTGDDVRYEGRGGTLTCGPTATGSRCVWKGAEVLGGTFADRIPPEALQTITRDLRAGAIRS
jgi:hypothetical protein